MNSFWSGFEKKAFLSIGTRIKDLSEDKKTGINASLPGIVSLDHRLTDKQLSPTIGIGLAGPYFGFSYRLKKKQKSEEPETQSKVDKKHQDKRD